MSFRLLPVQLSLFEDGQRSKADEQGVGRLRAQWRVLMPDALDLPDESDLPRSLRGWKFDETDRWLLRCVLGGVPTPLIAKHMGRTPRRVGQLLQEVAVRVGVPDGLTTRQGLLVRIHQLKFEEGSNEDNKTG